jgi:hypothetical protein
MTPRQIVELWVDRFNAGDVAGLAELYHDDAINHQVTQEPVSSQLARIRPGPEIPEGETNPLAPIRTAPS